MHEQLGRKPGAQDKVARTFVGQPPVIPHATENFDEVTLADNQCLECHGAQAYVAKGAPKVPDTEVLEPMAVPLFEAEAPAPNEDELTPADSALAPTAVALGPFAWLM